MLYDFSLNFNINILWFLWVIAPLCLWLLGSSSDKKVFRILMNVLSAFVSFIFIIVLYVVPVYSYNVIKSEIKQDRTLSVVGTVENFESPDSTEGGHEIEKFSIDGVFFEYTGSEYYGYNRFKCNGGVISGNGQRLNITYCIDPISKENVICSITKPN